MVLFVPRPWYRHCCRHNWHATLWHALLSWSYKMSAPLPTFNPHDGPITHSSTRIETWLSCTPSCFQSYSSRVASCVIHEPPSDEIINLVSDAILIPIALNPFHTSLQATNDCLCAWNFYFAPSCFTLDVFYLFNSRGTHMLIHGLIPGYYPYSILSFLIYPVTYS